ncbi:MAG: T9SS type A sorting domain-containing protein [Bacteroidetes bacterium]|nr:T9SS type A sorting domain-containing protein [Bacteroidota bacterium]
MKTIYTFIFFLAQIFVTAQDGVLDTSFGNSGIKTFANLGQIYDAKMLPNGQFFIVGKTFTSGENASCLIAKFNSDGTLDSSFGTGGKVLSTYGDQDEGYNKITFTSDNNIILSTTLGKLIRMTSNGNLDTSFGNQGIANFAHTVKILPNGKIITNVRTYTPANALTKIYQFTNNGILDNANFASPNGYISIDSQYQNVACIGIDTFSDGKIISVGEVQAASYFKRIYKLNPDGSTDAGFTYNNNNGFGNAGNIRTMLVYQNKLYLGGRYTSFNIARHNPDGSLDTSFNTTGYNATNVTETVQGVSDAQSMAVQSDGKIILAGCSKTTSSSLDYNSKFTMVRYNTNGTIDTTFGATGITRTLVNGNMFAGNCMILLTPSNNKILIIGNTNYSTSNKQDLAIAQYKNDSFLGSVDATFPKKNLILYPNPTASNLYFSQELSNITIYDAIGRKVFYQHEKTKQINIEKLPKGNYLLQTMDSENRKISKKIIKN